MRKKLLSTGLIGCILFGFTGCMGTSDVIKVTASTKCEAMPIDEYDVMGEFLSQNQNELEFLHAYNQFTANSMSAILTSTDKNVAYSPMSLYFALGLAAEGADGDTRKQMFEVLQVPDYSNEDFAEQISRLYRKNNYSTDLIACNIANSIWMDRNFSFNNSFINCASDDFYADLFTANLKDKAIGDEISSWIKDRTNGRLNPSIELGPDTMLAIINTIYFKGRFADEFDKNLTEEDTFTTDQGEKQKIDFMYQRFEGNTYQKEDNFDSFSMRFNMEASGTKGRIQFVLPKEGIKVEELVSDMESVDKILNYDASEIAHVNLWVPKVDYTCEVDLVSMLKSLGMEDAFDNGKSDFSKMTKSRCCISDVKQGTRIKFDEKGVEGATYTEVGVYATAAMVPEVPEVYIKLNRPFLYVITNGGGKVLFTGIVRNVN